MKYIFLDHKEFHIDIGKHLDALVFTLLILIGFYYYSCQQSPSKNTFFLHPNCYLSILSLNLPCSLWFDLGILRFILLRSPALGSEQAIVPIK